MVPVALIEREWSGSRLEVPLPEIFADLDYWIKNEGDDWLQAHLDASYYWLWDEFNFFIFAVGLCRQSLIHQHVFCDIGTFSALS